MLFLQETSVAANQLKTPSRLYYTPLNSYRWKELREGLWQQSPNKSNFPFLFSITLFDDTIFFSIVKRADFLQLCARRFENVNLYAFSRKHAFTPASKDNPDHKVKCGLCTFLINS